MRPEINKLLDQYSKSWFSSFSKLIHPAEWGCRKSAEEYLNKYYLSLEEYKNIWFNKQNEIFHQDAYLPELVYKFGFEMMALRGGCLFLENDFRRLQRVMQQIGDEYFVVIQQFPEYTEGETLFRMKFPVNISWQDLVAGNFISAILLEMPYNEYFVFGESGRWGKYSANDYEYPLDIIGFKPEYASLFRKHFVTTKKEHNEIQEWLPPEYRELIK